MIPFEQWQDDFVLKKRAKIALKIAYQHKRYILTSTTLGIRLNGETLDDCFMALKRELSAIWTQYNQCTQPDYDAMAYIGKKYYWTINDFFKPYDCRVSRASKTYEKRVKKYSTAYKAQPKVKQWRKVYKPVDIDLDIKSQDKEIQEY
jgi:hypothetical protein